MKKRKIVTVGKPNLQALSKTEAKVFYSTLLSAIIEFYKDKGKSAEIKHSVEPE